MFKKYILSFFIEFLYFLRIKKNFIRRIKFDLGLNNILLFQKSNYHTASDIQEVECKVFSQHGEDGIINYLLFKMGIIRPNFVEIGVGDYTEANTRFLYDRFYPKGIIIDCEKNLKDKVKINTNFWKGSLLPIEKQINTKNINEIISSNCDFDVDLFSIDIDGIDYWIIDKLDLSSVKIFIAEYNPVYGSDMEVTVPNLENFNRKDYHYSNLCYGMSLIALKNIMIKKNFYLIGTNSTRNNAFFISEEFKQSEYFPNIKIKDLDYYTDFNYRESRDKNNKLTYISGKSCIKEIKECNVVDLKDNNKIKKISELL